MNDEPQHRRWEDVQREIAAEVAQAMTSFRLTLDRLDRSVTRLQATVYGDAETRQRGIIDRLEQFEREMKSFGEKLDTLIDESRDRSNQILGARKAFYVLSAIIGIVGGPPAVAAVLRALGITL